MSLWQTPLPRVSWNGLAAVLDFKLGRSAEAGPCYERAIALVADRADSWLELGNAHRRLGEADAARRCYARVLTLAPDHPDAAALRRVVGGDG